MSSRTQLIQSHLMTELIFITYSAIAMLHTIVFHHTHVFPPLSFLLASHTHPCSMVYSPTGTMILRVKSTGFNSLFWTVDTFHLLILVPSYLLHSSIRNFLIVLCVCVWGAFLPSDSHRCGLFFQGLESFETPMEVLLCCSCFDSTFSTFVIS